MLIEDEAQWYGREVAGRHYRGDLVVHSFGRGKPVSLLGGGVLVSKPELTELVGQRAKRLVPESAGGLRWRARTALYNLLLAPTAYGLVARLPFLELGVTRYHPLTAIRLMDADRLRRLGVNIDRYCERGRSVQQRVHSMLAAAAPQGLIDLPAAADCLETDLLRYPLPCRDRLMRDRLYQALQRGVVDGLSFHSRR